MLLTIVRHIEFILGDLLCCVLSPFKRERPLPASPRSLLVIRDWSLGESLLALPVLERFKTRFPAAVVSVVVTSSSRPVFQAQPFVDEIIELDFRNVVRLIAAPNRFDVCFDMMPYFRHSAILGSWCARSTVGFDTFRTRSKLYDHKIAFDDSIHMVHMFDRFDLWDPTRQSARLVPINRQPVRDGTIRGALASPGLKIGVHLGTAQTAPWRAWSFDNFRVLIKELLRAHPDARIFLSGATAEREANTRMVGELRDDRIVNLEGKINIFELADLMTRLNVFVSSDTGPMHIAASVGCPTIGLFGPNTPVRFGPFPPEKNVALYEPPPGYRPTINVHKGEFENQEADRRFDVVNRVRPDRVLAEVEKILRSRAHH